jgi:hypothetical protein
MWIFFRQVAIVLPAAVVLSACAGKRAARRAPVESLDDALAPGKMAALLREQGGAHVHVSSVFRVDLAGAKPSAPAGAPVSPAAVTTTTDLWLDKHGNFRLQEMSDQDTGRDIVAVGGEIAVGLRYGKMIRRPAQSGEGGEGSRYLAQALGAPWACWEIVRRQVEVEGAPAEYRLRLGPRRELPAGFPAADGLRKWRATVTAQSVDGHARMQPGGKLLLDFTCMTDYRAARDGVPIEGNAAVAMAVDELGTTGDVVMPESETLSTRQRTILDERALLGGIRSAPSYEGRSSR